jgi:LPXTG-motif cell wall-anchored protein
MQRQWIGFLAAVVCGFSATEARAEMIAGSDGLHGLGAFTGTFTYLHDSSAHARLVVELTNASPGGSGFLTAFAFNNPGDRIKGVSLVSSDPDFVLLGANSYRNGVPGNPFGQFDLGAGTGGSFRGGGKPSKGLAVGHTGTFTFSLIGIGLDELTAASFFDAPSARPGRGQGPASFVARFRGFAPQGSDKVPGHLVVEAPPPSPNHAPEPSALLIAGLGGVSALTGWLWRKRRKTPAATQSV